MIKYSIKRKSNLFLYKDRDRSLVLKYVTGWVVVAPGDHGLALETSRGTLLPTKVQTSSLLGSSETV